MDKDFCRRIDKELLVEQYITGKLKGVLLEQFEQHIQKCAVHAQAVTLEKALKRGVTEFARGEIKTKLRERIQKRDDNRYILLRYAAILVVAVITPLLLYYQLNLTQENRTEAPGSPQKTAEEPAEQYTETEPTVAEPEIKQIPEQEEKDGIQGVGATEQGATDETGLKDVLNDGGAKMPEKPLPMSSQETKQGESLQILEIGEDQKKSAKNVESDYSTTKLVRSANKMSVPASSRRISPQDQLDILMIDLNKKIKSNESRIKNCMERSLNEKELLDYQIRLSIKILKKGSVGEIKVLDAKVHSVDLENCITDIINEWTFIPAQNEREIERIIQYKEFLKIEQ